MLKLKGISPQSTFRRMKLVDYLQKSVQFPLNIENISAEYVYFLDLKTSILDEPSFTKIKELLQITDSIDDQSMEVGDSQQEYYLVVPRLGTISPWSFKAIDILQNCGLDNIAQIERGIAYYISVPKPFSNEKRHTMGMLLHDVLTEEILYNIHDANSIFNKNERALP